MGHVRRLGCVAIAWGTLLHACSSGYSSTTGTDAGSEPPPPPAEGGTSDAPTDTDGAPSDAGGDDAGAATNLLTNGDFELGCAGWPGYLATATDSAIAHGGTRACQMCLDQGSPFGLVYQVVKFSPGDKLAGEAWFHADADASAASVEVHFNVFDADGGFVSESPPNVFTATATWTRASTLFMVPAAAAQISFTANVSGGAGLCAIVDDAVANRDP
ncbi:MAG TPA: hypothetical protein VIF62_26470 [Labilithrix sp.]|jgi:hypothetical protein